jgi:MYXO-CTERM domain-containing protein
MCCEEAYTMKRLFTALQSGALVLGLAAVPLVAEGHDQSRSPEGRTMDSRAMDSRTMDSRAMDSRTMSGAQSADESGRMSGSTSSRHGSVPGDASVGMSDLSATNTAMAEDDSFDFGWLGLLGLAGLAGLARRGHGHHHHHHTDREPVMHDRV